MVEQTQDFRLNYKKVEGDRNLPDYENGLLSAIEIYSMDDTAFSHPKEKVIQGAERLLSGYEVDPLFASEPERNLFALAISDAWLSTDRIKEKKSLLDILKLVATGAKENENLGSLSNKVRILSSHGIARGVQFDPEATGENSHSEYVEIVIKFIGENTDNVQTEKVAKVLGDWGEDSKLKHARDKLGISDPESEKPFHVVVLNKSAQQVREALGCTSFSISKPGELTIVFNLDYDRFDSLEHEYAHSQGELSRWYQHLLFRGVNEALTERSTSSPFTYPEQREFLDSFLQDHPKYEALMYKAYTGDEGARTQLFSSIVKDYGLAKFLTFARVAPIGSHRMFGCIGDSIYIEPNVSMGVLKK